MRKKTKPSLTPLPARHLSDRECAKILGGTIGALLALSDKETVTKALGWWANSPEACDALNAIEALARLA